MFQISLLSFLPSSLLFLSMLCICRLTFHRYYLYCQSLLGFMQLLWLISLLDPSTICITESGWPLLALYSTMRE